MILLTTYHLTWEWDGLATFLACMCGAGLILILRLWYVKYQLKKRVESEVALPCPFCGETEIGQGSDSILAAMVAEVLGIDLKDIRLCVGDTDLTPVDLGSYSSRVTLMVGHAAREAAEKARDIIADAVGQHMEMPKESFVFADGNVFPAHDPDKGI